MSTAALRAGWPYGLPSAAGGLCSRITHTAIFDPFGLGVPRYWYRFYPIHWPIFRRMLRGVVARSGFG